jgi:TRAP-type uncharacterized transport system substrate-binding protein
MVRRGARPTHGLGWGVIASLLVLVLVGAVAATYTFARLNYRVATGPEGGEGQRLFTAIAPIFAAESSLIHLTGVPTDDPRATAQALESGAVDLAIIRPDLAIPTNGRTIAVLRREPVLLIVPANGKIEKVAELKGKAVGLVHGSAINDTILTRILSYYEIPDDSVQRIVLTPGEVTAAVKQRRVAAFFVVGPVGRGLIGDVVAAITQAGNGAPDFLGVEEAEAIARRSLTLEKLEIARGSLQGNPAVPDESITTLAISRRLVARQSMYDYPAGEIARLLLTNKAKISGELPFAYQIEAPDTDKDVVLPTHSGAAAYVNGEQKSFYDTFESLFWMGWMLCTLVGVSYAAVRSRINRLRRDAITETTERVLRMLSEARHADAEDLDALEQEVDEILEEALTKRAGDLIDEERFQFLALARGHVRQAIDRRRTMQRKPALKAAGS